MKKAVLCLCFVLFSMFFAYASSQQVVINTKMQSPTISPESWWGGERIPGGVRYTITNNEEGAVLYYGVLNQREYDRADYMWAREGRWETDWLLHSKETTELTVTQDFTSKGMWYLYAVSVKDNKASSFCVQTVDVNSVNLSTYDISIRDGVISNTGTGKYREMYASLDPNMEDARLIYDGVLPLDLMGKTVWFQVRNTMGFADSAPVMVEVSSLSIDKPRIQSHTALRGYEVEIQKPNVYIGSGGVGRGGAYASDEEIEVYYTTDGSTPNVDTSHRYSEPITISAEGNSVVKAIAVYKGLTSDIASGSNLYLTKVQKPSVVVSGLDIRLIAKDGSSVFMGYSDDDISTQVSCFTVGNDDIGRTIYFQAVRKGFSPSEVYSFTVESLEGFQEMYSSNKTRQFGYWIVLSEVNSRGAETGNYTLCGRFPMGNNMVIVVIANVVDGKIDKLAFSCPTSKGVPLSDVELVSKESKSVTFNVNDEVYTIPYSVYQISRSYDVYYWILATEEDQSKLFDLLNSKKYFTTIAVLQDEINMMDALSGLAVAGQYSNAEAAYSSYINSIELNESQFVFSSEGFDEALDYYLSLTK